MSYYKRDFGLFQMYKAPKLPESISHSALDAANTVLDAAQIIREVKGLNSIETNTEIQIDPSDFISINIADIINVENHLNFMPPVRYATVHEKLGLALMSLPFGNKRINLELAFIFLANALKIYRKTAEMKGDTLEESFPLEYVQLQNKMGEIYRKFPLDEKNNNMLKALAYLQNASELCLKLTPQKKIRYRFHLDFPPVLRFYTKQDFAIERAAILYNLGIVYTLLYSENTVKNMEQAIKCFEEALYFYNKKEYPFLYAQVKHYLGKTFYQLSLNSNNSKEFIE